VSKKPRFGVVAVDDGLYGHRWVWPLLRDPRLDPAFVVRLSPWNALDFNPGGSRGLGPVSISRLRYYGLRDGFLFSCKAAAEGAADLGFRLGLFGRPRSIRSAARSLALARTLGLGLRGCGRRGP
jgi:hypothetical protein